MRVLGHTTSGKIVCDNIGLEDYELPLFYSDFSKTDHYDALCVWSLYPSTDYLYKFRNREYHGSEAGVSRSRLITDVADFTRWGRKLKNDRMPSAATK